MSGQDAAREILDAITDYGDPTVGSDRVPSGQRPPRLATVDPAYSGVGDPRVTFDGELTMSTKGYPYLSAKPLAGDRVVMLPVGRGYLVLGKVGEAPSAGPRNLIRNARFRINQRSYASGGTLAVDAFGPDGWRSIVASTQLTLPTGPNGGALTIYGSTTKAIRQVVERADVVPGAHVLSWSGTVVGRVYNAGASAPTYAASPIAVTLDGSDDVRVEFKVNTGTSSTLENPSLTRGAVAPALFLDASLTEDLARCQRYFVQWGSATTNVQLALGMGNNGGNTVFNLITPVPLRTTPTIATTGTWRATLLGTSDIAVSGFTLLALAANVAMLSATHATAAAGSLRGINSSTAWTFALSAEL